MKKNYLVLSSFLLLALAACGNEDTQTTPDEDQETAVEEVEQDTVEEEDNDEEDSETEEESNEEIAEDDVEEEENVGELEELEEYSILEDHIDLNKYTPKTEEDNPHKRIIIFKDTKNDEDGYKSIYIKKENRLKIIEFGQGEIYDEKI